jgi:hypothetical protein
MPGGRDTTRLWHRCQRNATHATSKKGNTHTLPNYSRHLHLSTGARTFRRPAARQIKLCIVGDLRNWVAPSKTTSLRWRHRHRHMSINPVQKSQFAPGPPRFSCNQLTSWCLVAASSEVWPTSRARTEPIRRQSKISSTWSQMSRSRVW